MKKINKKENKKKINWPIFIGSFVIVHLFAFLGSSVTNSDTAWYNSIKPEITPPGFVFGIVWTILFLMIWLSLYFACTNAKQKDKMKVRLLFLINLVLNFLWSYLFFGMQKPALAFAEIILVWISILSMVILLRKISKLASWLLVPYLLWVSFAIVLNYLAAFG
jgi:tryptophan-rich sensory protein